MNKNPIILIIGRQNVGKSTLFNLLIKSRKSITDSTPGVTRDLVYGNLKYDNFNLKIIDSGGITSEKNETAGLVHDKIINAQKDADIILFLVDINNTLPVEYEYIKLLRKTGKKIIIAVNKCDTPDKDNFINEFYKLGLGEPIPISAAHNRNIDLLLKKIINELNKEEFITSTEEKTNDIIKIAILGKPNVGKSSLLNKIVGRERSIVSKVPGTTRDIIDADYIFSNKHFLFLDTAGIRRKSKVTENIEYYSVNRAIKSISLANIIYLVIDSLDEISDQDKKICDQIINKGRGLIVVLNKWDLIKDLDTSFNKKKEMLLFKFPLLKYVPIINVSSKTGEGIKRLLKESIKVYEELFHQIGTNEFNIFLQNILNNYAPSSKKGVLKIYYGTQINSNPTKFIIFINKKKLLSNNYKNYIINKIREKYGYSGIPIEIVFKDKKNN